MNFDFSHTQESFDKTIAFLKQEYLQISTGRANPSLLDGVFVDSYGSKQPVKNVASINTEDARTLRVSPWDKGQIKAIEKALVDSGMPFSVAVDDAGVRVNVPQLTEESRRSIVKLLKDKLEEARVKVRAIRQDTMKEIEDKEKAGDFAEDAKNRFKDELQKKVDATNEALQELLEHKEADVMKV